MYVLKGLLKEADYTKLQMNHVYLMQQLDGQFLVDEMFAAGVFGESDLEEILSQDSREKRTRIFLKKLRHSGPGPAFNVFLRTLELQYPHVAERLKESSTENENGLNEDTEEGERPSARQVSDEKSGLYIKLPSAYSPCWLKCQIHPGHTKFIPINSFGAHHLPPHFQIPEVVEYVRVLAEQTVMMRTRYISDSRPEGYPLSENKGKTGKWWGGSGRVWREMRKFSHLNHETCPCHDCKHSSSPARQWGQFIVVTSKTAVFDDKECEKTDFILWYDEPQVDQAFPALKGVRLISSNIVTNHSEVVCVTHDRHVSEKLEAICRKNSDLSAKLAETCYQRKSNGKLTIIVSHPHWASKRVTVGEWVEGDNDRTKGPNNHVYTTATCLGSGGAPVLLLDDRMSCCTTVSGIRSSGEGYSGGKLWPL